MRQLSVQFLYTGHFALEIRLEEIAAAMRHFLVKIIASTTTRI
jgi:hypothetical protein